LVFQDSPRIGILLGIIYIVTMGLIVKFLIGDLRRLGLNPLSQVSSE
jgi:hypothetical protein